MHKTSLLLCSLLLAFGGAHAQAQAPAASPAKKELVARVLRIQQPGVEAIARELARQPASDLVAGAVDYIQSQVPADRQEALARGVQQDADKYMNETFPIVRDRALQLAPQALGPLLEEKFSEEELKQVVAMLESPVYRKYQALGGDMQRALVTRLVPEVRPQVEPRLRALDEAIAKRLGVAPAGGTAPPAGNRPPAKK